VTLFSRNHLITQASSKTFLLIISVVIGIIPALNPEVAFAKNFKRSQPKLNQTEAPKASPSDRDRDAPVGVGDWLSQERIIFLSGKITPELAEGVVSQLLYLDAQAPGKDIYLYINSGGGEINAGLAIYDTMRALRSNVVTVCLGEASSMASLLLAGGTKGKRLALPNSRIMIHQPLYGVDGQASDLAIAAKEILYLKGLLNRLLAEFTGQPLKRIEIDTDRDFFMSVEQAKAYGLIDQVITKLPASRP
jgi:ATP-dependent Clp protease protease subunit